MPISWNEIRQNAIQFSHDWADVQSEIAEKQTFWNQFFAVFGISRRKVANFEERVKNLAGNYDRIDLFWPGMLLVEHKSRGEDLDTAESEAQEYITNLINAGWSDEVPRYVITSDFARIHLLDLEPDDPEKRQALGGYRIEFPLGELHKYIREFAFIPGYKQHHFEDQDPINLQAVRIMGDLHDTLEAGGYEGHELERLLVRILFCLFAEDTGIFERDDFRLYIENRTQPDGSDLGPHLARLFEILNTPEEKRQKNLDETLASFPYVNGELFAEKLGFADFNRDMRNALLACTRFDWSQISPAIFGSLFQAVMEPKERRQIGGHYTSERDILKVIRSLFLDDLRAQFERIKSNKNQLKQFHKNIADLRFLDPACGCGNFLVVTYRELRLLEIEVLKAIFGTKQQRLDISGLSLLDVDAFYGIEIGEWPARIAEVAMWLMDHQMNIRLSETFGQYYVRLPLKKSPTIILGNALRLDWKKILPPDKCSYILGNPPFVGGKYQAIEQRADMDFVAAKIKSSGLLDYVTGWYFKASEYIQHTKIIVGFVSTNSITQGEQVGILWNALFKHYGIKIHFCHRTFPWESEARGKAHVHVVIIGFAVFNGTTKRIYECHKDNIVATNVKNISPYLIEGPDGAIENRNKPICKVPEIGIGNKPIDGGYYLFTREEKNIFLQREPLSRIYFRRWMGSDEFINGIERWCLWLGDCSSQEIRKMPEVRKRVELVAKYRRGEIPAKDKKDEDKNKKRNILTKKLAETPTRYHVENIPKSKYLVLPEVSSERRKYIPIGFVKPRVLCSNLVKIFPNAKFYHFGILSSAMHMAWVRQVGGRLKSDFRYSAKLVYNNYPWPKSPSAKQISMVEVAAKTVLKERGIHLQKGATLADLYDPIAMPAKLVKAHAALDRAVDRCYRSQPFTTERQRVEFLFGLYEKLTAPLIAATEKKQRRNSKENDLGS
jgi:hypothetical protein